MIIGIVAIAENLAIGKDGKLPWHYPADLKFFKRTTTGNTIVMGRKTWDAIGRALPDRLNVILSRSHPVAADAGVVLHTSAEVSLLSRYVAGDVYIIGGAHTYQAFASAIDEWLVTDIPLDVKDADTFMPGDLLDGFAEIERTELEPGLSVRRMRREAESTE